MIIDLFSLLKAFGLNLKMDKQHPLKCGGSTYSPIKGTEDDFTTDCHCQNGVLSIHKLNRFVTSCYQSIRHCYSNGVYLYLDIHMIKRQYPYLWKDVGQEKAKVGPACHSECIQKCFYVKLTVSSGLYLLLLLCCWDALNIFSSHDYYDTSALCICWYQIPIQYLPLLMVETLNFIVKQIRISLVELI